MFTITVATRPGTPGRVFGRIGLQGRGLTRDCLLAFRGRLGLVGVVRLDDYAIGVEPLVGMLGRLLLHTMDDDFAPARSPTSYASVSVYQGDRIEQAALREHLVATSNGVLLDVEFADEHLERRTAGAAHRYLSAVTLTGHAISTLLWAGGKPKNLQPLSSVPKHETELSCVLAAEIPPYTRRRFMRSLGAEKGPRPEIFFASDWENFLSGVESNAEGARMTSAL